MWAAQAAILPKLGSTGKLVLNTPYLWPDRSRRAIMKHLLGDLSISFIPTRTKKGCPFRIMVVIEQ